MNIAGTDLNLLKVFLAIHAEGSVSRAAERLGVSQPTVSHALARLRETWRDPLFVRRAAGVTPTARADRLAVAVRQALQVLDVAASEGERYDPARSERTFRLHLTDIGETIFLPRLMPMLAAEAPLVRLEAHQLEHAVLAAALESGRIDLAMGYIPSLDVERTVLLHERYVVVMRRGHPLARLAPTRGALARLDYVLVRAHPATARALRDLGLADRIRLSIPHFMVLPRILAETDLAVVMPSRLYTEFARLGRYTVWRPRVGMPSFDVSVHWAARHAGDPGLAWLRGRIVRMFRESG
ncbi:MAG TPA: LysR family transcriptional regulator [Casimicrobiaceae bacterium]|nr:LysR family transcriptional regulator [Casimicrobiaceae bacterium]